MRYARKHEYTVLDEGGAEQVETRLVDVVDVPVSLPRWANNDPAAFLTKMYPNYDVSEFVQVPDDAVSGALDNGDGTFTNP